MFRRRSWGGEWGQRTPVELREYRTADTKLEVGVPVLQAHHVAVSAAFLFPTFVLAAWAAGPIILWLSVGVVAATTFTWYLIRSARWEHPADAWLEVALGVVMTFLVGLVGKAISTVAGYIVGSGELSPVWFDRVARFALIGLFIYALVRTLLLMLAFLQELAQRSPFQEQSLWGALGEVLKARYAHRPPQKYREPVIVHGSRGREMAAEPEEPVLIPPEVEMAQLDALDFEHFLVQGERGVGFTRRVWVGRQLPSGRRMTDGTWRNFTQWLTEAGILESSPSGTKLTVSLGEALSRIAAPDRDYP